MNLNIARLIFDLTQKNMTRIITLSLGPAL